MSAEASSLTFEQALSELEQIVQKLEAGDASLDEAINAYSRGIELKNQCQQRLESARLQVEKIEEGMNRDGLKRWTVTFTEMPPERDLISVRAAFICGA